MPFSCPAKGYIFTVVAPDLKTDTQIGWLVFERIFGEIGHLNFLLGKVLGSEKKSKNNFKKRKKKLSRV